MHIPDGFLAPPVWGTLDLIAIPAIGYLGRKAQQRTALDDGDMRLPLMGVMGAFVFAAQIINFPVGVGTSSHLVGGALLAMTLGPAAASLVMTAILVIQALVFQDGGVLALGANVFNMAILGVWAGYLPYRIWAKGSRPGAAVFVGGFLSVLVSALLALGELRVSGVPMPGKVLGISLGVFVLSAAIEGAITLAVYNALSRMSGKYIRNPQAGGTRVYAAVGLSAILLVTAGFLVASTHPDGIEKLVYTGFASATHSTFAPLADYNLPFLASPWLRKAGAGLLGLGIIYGLCLMVGRLLVRKPVPQAVRVSGD